MKNFEREPERSQWTYKLDGRSLGWIGYTLRKPTSSTTRQALSWNPQGKKKRNSRRRETEAELKTDARHGLEQCNKSSQEPC